MALAAQSEGESFGRYRLLEQIGAGGMAQVFRAVTDTAQGQQSVVIKRMLPALSRDPVFVKMLVAEARLSSRLNHPGIVRVHELGRVGSEYFLAMEHVSGGDLVRLLNRCAASRMPLPIPVICYIAREVALALAYAHDLTDSEGRALEIVHRDVSPSNIMVTFDGGVKLLDFGVAKAAAHVRDERTRTGTLKGKINYLSPEQAEGLAADRRADVFALGIVLYEALTLKRLFRGDTDLETLRLVRRCEVTPPSQLREGVPPALEALLLRMLARDPAERVARCDQAAEALAPLAADRAALTTFLGRLGFSWATPVAGPRREGPEEALALDHQPTHVIEQTSEEIVVGEPPAPVAPTVRARWRRPVTWAAAALLAASGVATAWQVALWRSAARAAAALAAAPAPARPAPATAAPAPALGTGAVAAAPARTLTVVVDVAAARITLDGRVVAAAAHRLHIPIDHAGTHTLAIAAPRRKPYTHTIDVPASGDVELAIKLERATATEHAPAAAPTRPSPRGEDYLVDPFAAHK